MKITVHDDNGSECYLYDTRKDVGCLCPSRNETPLVVEALDEAVAFLVGRKDPMPLMGDLLT